MKRTADRPDRRTNEHDATRTCLHKHAHHACARLHEARVYSASRETAIPTRLIDCLLDWLVDFSRAKKIASNPSLRFTRPGLHRPRRLRDDDDEDDGEEKETFVARTSLSLSRFRALNCRSSLRFHVQVGKKTAPLSSSHPVIHIHKKVLPLAILTGHESSIWF